MASKQCCSNACGDFEPETITSYNDNENHYLMVSKLKMSNVDCNINEPAMFMGITLSDRIGALGPTFLIARLQQQVS